jgi:hypothetical protein
MATYSENSMRGRNTKNIGAALGFKPVAAAAPKAIAKPAPAPPAPEPPAPSNVDNGTGEVQYGAVTLDNPAPATPDTSIETLMKSPEYLARERALAAAMEQFTAGQATEAARYGENYNKSLAELGYDPTSNKWDLGELMSSGQRATASGKAYEALRNDFAARGMLQSGAYQAKRGVLSNQLNEQLNAIQQAKVRFGEDQNAKLLAQQAQAEQQRQAALEAARQSILNSMGA